MGSLTDIARPVAAATRARISFLQPNGDPELMAGPVLDQFVSATGQRAAGRFDILFIPMAPAPFKQALRRAFGVPVVDITDLIPIWSDADLETRRQAYSGVARLAAFMAERVSGAGLTLDFAAAITMLPAIERAAMYARCFDLLLAQGHRRIAVIANPTDTNGGLCASVAAARADAEPGLWWTIGDGIEVPALLDRPLPRPREWPMADPAPARTRIAALPRTTPDPAGPVLVHCASAYPFYIRHTLPVIEALLARDLPVVVVMVPPAHAAMLGPLAGRVRVIELDGTMRPQAEAIWAELKPAIQQAARQFSEANGDAISQGARYASRHPYFLSGMVDLLAQMLQLNAHFLNLRPRACWLANARDAGDDILLGIAGHHGVPCLTGLAGLIVDNVISAPFFHSKTYWASYGEAMSRILRGRGHGDDRILLAGAPHFDALYHAGHGQARSRFRAAHRLPAKSRVIGIFTSRVEAEAENDWLITLARWAKSAGHVVFYKQHPDRAPRRYDELEAIVAASGLDNIIWAECGSVEALEISDICITDHSTIAIEAAILHRPIVQVRIGAPHSICDYHAEGIAALATSAAELVAGMPGWLAGLKLEPGARSRFIARFNWGDDGQAAARIAGFLAAPPPPLSSRNALLEQVWGAPGTEAARW